MTLPFFLKKGEILIKEVSEDSIVEFPECTRHLSIIAVASAQKTTFLPSSCGAKQLRSLAIFESSGFNHTLLDGLKLLRSLDGVQLCSRF